MNTMTPNSSRPTNFWSMSYRGHEIAVHQHYSGCIMYLNKVMQHGIHFADPRSAANWLRRKVDARATVA